MLNGGRGGFPGWDGLLPRAGGMPSPGGMNVLPGWDDWLVELTAFPGRDALLDHRAQIFFSGPHGDPQRLGNPAEIRLAK